MFELAAEDAFEVELVDRRQRVFEARLGVVDDEQVAVALVERQARVLSETKRPAALAAPSITLIGVLRLVAGL